MVVRRRSGPNVLDTFKHFRTDVSLLEVLLVFEDLERFQVGVLVETTFIKAIKWLWQVDARKSNDVARCTLPSQLTFSKHFERSRHMTNRNLVTWFLNLDLLERDEFRRFDLDLQLAFDVVFLALIAWTFDQRVELFSLDDNVDLIAADIACVDSDLDARLNITGPCDDTSDCDK